MVPSLALLVDGGISKNWELVEGVSSLKTHLWRAVWALGASLFLSALNSNHVPCHATLPQTQSSRYQNLGLKSPKSQTQSYLFSLQVDDPRFALKL